MLDDAGITAIEWMKDTLQPIHCSASRVLKKIREKHTHAQNSYVHKLLDRQH